MLFPLNDSPKNSESLKKKETTEDFDFDIIPNYMSPKLVSMVTLLKI
jgi:hypothetical protein